MTLPGHASEPVPAVRTRGLRKRYGDREILRGVDLEIAAGETYALLGPNGAGKSTAIEILEGVRRPSGGEVAVLGADPLTAPRGWKSRIGIVAQSTGDLGPYTPRELIAHFGALYPEPLGVDEVLALVGLEDRAGVRAAKLSGGQQRRLDVALGIVGRPRLLFLDEPTTGFDPEARRMFWEMLSGLSGTGTAILLTTHYLDEAAHLADRVGVLSGGRIVAEAPPAELGGAEARTPLVRWRDAHGVRHEERSETPGALVGRLCAEAAAGGLAEPAELEVRRPSLEEIYLGMLADGGEDSGAARDGVGPAGLQTGSAAETRTQTMTGAER
ncbi:ABC transporter ATP-binding protein [Leucobacter allii]|uniref:ABC transporter ATP-binding protein n=1 Tax=Leucobacter allii TaxID=2932247 RepID=A0ABY4FLX4_9MICO|nr:ABC transporter ATP-binding protein [Leucobacter allii]UOQ57287.1 ABC transporter ATP-binding protein [Leucobacter allii]